MCYESLPVHALGQRNADGNVNFGQLDCGISAEDEASRYK